jgi:hypothetical protein
VTRLFVSQGKTFSGGAHRGVDGDAHAPLTGRRPQKKARSRARNPATTLDEPRSALIRPHRRLIVIVSEQKRPHRRLFVIVPEQKRPHRRLFIIVPEQKRPHRRLFVAWSAPIGPHRRLGRGCDRVDEHAATDSAAVVRVGRNENVAFRGVAPIA